MKLGQVSQHVLGYLVECVYQARLGFNIGVFIAKGNHYPEELFGLLVFKIRNFCNG